MDISRVSIKRFPLTKLTPFFSFFVIILLCYTTNALAQSWYIKPSSELPLRRGQGTDYKILSIVPDGTKVTILEENEPWVKVVTEGGNEGWMLKRYLSLDKPSSEVIGALQIENSTLKKELTDITTMAETATGQKEKLSQDLDICVADLGTTQEQFQTLREDTENVVLMKKNLEKSREIITRLEAELNKATTEIQNIESSQDIKWFLAGGGTLIFGCIVGMISARSRKRKSSYY